MPQITLEADHRPRRTPHELKQIVARAAEILDMEFPRWQVFLDRDALDMGDSDNCVLGQLYGSLKIDELLDLMDRLSKKYDVNAYTAFAYDTYPEESEDIEEFWRIEAFVRI